MGADKTGDEKCLNQNVSIETVLKKGEVVCKSKIFS